MREKRSDYFENTTSAIAVHREYGERNPRDFKGYSRNFWGVTAGGGPSNRDLRFDGRDQRFFGYMFRGVPYGPMTARSRLGRCLRHCLSTPTPRLRAWDCDAWATASIRFQSLV